MMKYNADIMLVWSGAAMEAETYGQDEIEPSHILCYALKFAEIDSGTIKQIAKGEEEVQVLMAAHDKLLEILISELSIEVPSTSTPFRRALRRKSDQANNQNKKMLHRSTELLEVFEDASKIADSEGRNSIELCDLIHVIFEKRYESISKVMKKLNIPLAPENKNGVSKDAQKYEGILFVLNESGYSDVEEKKRIESDPIVKTLCLYLGQYNLKPHRPCLLVRASTRYGEDILKDALKFSSMNQTSIIKIGSVHCNALLQNLSSNNKLYDVSAIEEIIDAYKHIDAFFFDSVHRYLSKPIVGEVFLALFKQWLKGLDGRYIFETSEEQYRTNFEAKLDWKGVFHIIWLHELPKNDDYNL